MNRKTAQIALVLVVIVLTAFIYFKGKNTNTASIELETAAINDWDYNISTTIDTLLTVDSIAEFMKDVYPKNETEDSLIWLNKAATLWDSLGHGLMAAYYYEKVANKTNEATDWYKAGRLFFNLQNLAPDSFSYSQISARSMKALKATVDLDPNNLDAKAELGVCYMESGTMPPMVGIGLLKEVLQVNPEHNAALYYLAYFSMKSGQYDKAVERLTVLVSLNPENPNYYRYLGQAYLQMDDKENAKAAFENFIKYETDEASIAQAEEIINQMNI